MLHRLRVDSPPWICAAVLLPLLSAPSRSGATDYYVASSGSDRNDGTETAPFATIRQAASATQPGDNVFIRGGTYRDGVTVTRSGTADAWVTFAAYPGELPILDGGGGGGTGFNIEASFIRVRGLAAQNWSSSGFANGWDVSPGNVQFINLVAENNGINGIAFYKNTGVLIEGCIVAHNGNQQPSWSSGVNVFQVGGTHEDNIVRGTVSFENIDISDNHTDGNGFIVDEGSTGALFENNIAFRNGGSCIRLTNSSGTHIINNTCFQNGLDPNNTPSFVADEIFFSEARSRTDTIVRNNLAVAVAGKAGLSHTTGTGVSVFESNFVVDEGGPSPFFMSTAGALDLRVREATPQIIDQGAATDAPAFDIGFDFRCIRPAAGQAVQWWQHAPDYAYIESVGGVAGCFSPLPRPQQGAPDIGAYEFGVAPAPCTAPDCTPGAPAPSGETPNPTLPVDVPDDSSADPTDAPGPDLGSEPPAGAAPPSAEVPTAGALPPAENPRAASAGAGGCSLPAPRGSGGLVFGSLLASSIALRRLRRRR